jgi:transcriptional regulator with XRE-family HTH domain
MTEDSSKGEFPLKTLRKDLGLTQSAFARLLGVEVTTVGRWERGERDPQLSLSQVGVLDRAAQQLHARLADYIDAPPADATADGA